MDSIIDCTARSGSKEIVQMRLTKELRMPLIKPTPNNVPHRILSIDMGIRNLALCLLNIKSEPHPPQVSHWKRVTVSEKPESKDEVESFDPIDFAPKAYTLIKNVLEEYEPHTVLIEQQRYRSAGGAAIQEWTVRVNMLESMFHAILYTFAQQKQLDLAVHSVSPQRMTKFWLADVDLEQDRAKETKYAKIALVERIIEGNGPNVVFKGEAEATALGFRSRGRGVATLKMDDLADSLLQGLAWWKWDVNRREMWRDYMSEESEILEREARAREHELAEKDKARRKIKSLEERESEPVVKRRGQKKSASKRSEKSSEKVQTLT